MGYFILTYSMVEVYFADLLNSYAISGGNPISVLKKQAICTWSSHPETSGITCYHQEKP